MAFKGHAHAKLPATFDARQLLVQVHPGEKGDRLGVRDFAVEQRSQAVPTGEAVEKFVRRYVVLREQTRGPVGELRQCALPKNLVFLVGDGAKAMLVECKSVGTSEQGTATRAFPF